MDRIALRMAVLLTGKEPFESSMDAPDSAEIWNIVAGILIVRGISPNEVSRLFDGKLHVYDRKRKQFLNLQKTLAAEGVEKEAVLVVSDVDDEKRLAAATTDIF